MTEIAILEVYQRVIFDAQTAWMAFSKVQFNRLVEVSMVNVEESNKTVGIKYDCLVQK